MPENSVLAGLAVKALRTDTDLPLSLAGVAVKVLRIKGDLPVNLGGLAIKVLREVPATPFYLLTESGRIPLSMRPLT